MTDARHAPDQASRIEHDSMGEIAVPADHWWGAQTQRSLQHFRIGPDLMPVEVVHALAQVKQAAAQANRDLGVLSPEQAGPIITVAREIAAREWDDEFPLYVYQTGSGTQTNANVNEVIANRANAAGTSIHPNDHVNASQSSNDTFVTAMHVAARSAAVSRLLPALYELRDAIDAKARAWEGELKIGRTHLMDATPLTVGQEWSGYAAALTDALGEVERAADGLLPVALGGTAVGTGVNAPPGFTAAAVRALAAVTGQPFVPAGNPFAAQATLDPLVRAHAALRGVAVTLFKFGNDVRWAASGPRAGLAELRIPANEPGSTIMPGKVNPTQVEALLQVCITVIGHDTAVAMAGAEGNFELNVFRPLVIHEFLSSCRLLHDAADSVRRHLVEGAELNERRLQRDLSSSVMAVTALTPQIGYEAAAGIAKLAMEEDLSIKEAAVRLGVAAEVVDAALAAASGGGG